MINNYETDALLSTAVKVDETKNNSIELSDFKKDAVYFPTSHMFKLFVLSDFDHIDYNWMLNVKTITSQVEQKNMYFKVADPKGRFLSLPWDKQWKGWKKKEATSLWSYFFDRELFAYINSPPDKVNDRIQYLKENGVEILTEPMYTEFSVEYKYDSSRFLKMKQSTSSYFTWPVEIWPEKLEDKTDPNSRVVRSDILDLGSRDVDGYYDFENCNLYEQNFEYVSRYNTKWFTERQPLLSVAAPYSKMYLEVIDPVKPIRFRVLMLQTWLRRNISARAVYQTHVRYSRGEISKW